MRNITIRNLCDANLGLDPVGAGFAAQKTISRLIGRSHRNLENTRQTARAHKELAVLDAEFHRLICGGTNNEIFATMHQPLHDLFMPMVSGLARSIVTSSRMITAHQEIVNAVEMRDSGAARMWARRHIQDFRRGYIRARLDFGLPLEWEPRA